MDGGSKMLKKRKLKRAAFTLLEVMVVMTIMTSQANNYGDVKKIAYQKVCENNLRQLYQGLMMQEITDGGLPDAAFFPKHPKADPRSLVNIMGPAWAESLVCPVFPSAIKDKGLTYLYNDTLAGQTLDSVGGDTWVLMEMNAVSDEIPMPHPGGFHVLYANGRIRCLKEIPPFFAELQDKMKKRQKPEESGR